MSARRCSPCDISFPNFTKYERCPACGEDTWYVKDMDSDDDYVTKAEERHAELESTRARAADSKIDLATLYPHPEGAEVDIHERRGRLFVLHYDLIQAGYRCLEDFSIVFINDTWYELQGHGPAYRLVGKYHPDGVWWIEEVPTDLLHDTIPLEEVTT